MNIAQSKPGSSSCANVLKLPMRLWRKFQIWRGHSLMAEADRLIDAIATQIRQVRELRAKATKLIGDNAKPPNDLFD